MKHSVTLKSFYDSTMTADMLQVGQMGVILGKDKYAGDVVLRTYMCLVSLNNPNITWTGPVPGLIVKPIVRGTEVLIIVDGE